MKKPLLLALAALLLLTAPAPLRAAEECKADDKVVLDLAAENWVTTKTARVSLNIEAAVAGGAAGTMRASMAKAVADVVKADWRLTSFNRSMDQTGMERWSAQYEARVPETDLGNLADNAKKASKAGMQLTVASIDFSPTLDERQAVISQTRTQLYKQASEQLAALNAALPGRGYRIALIDFSGESDAVQMIQNRIARPMMAMKGGAAMDSMESGMASMERSEKITLSAHVILAATPAAASK